MAKIVLGQTEITYAGDQKLNIELSDAGHIILSFTSHSDSSRPSSGLGHRSRSQSTVSSTCRNGSLTESTGSTESISDDSDFITPPLDVDMSTLFDTESADMHDDFNFPMSLPSNECQMPFIASAHDSPWYDMPMEDTLPPLDLMAGIPPIEPVISNEHLPKHPPADLKLSDKRMTKLHTLLDMLRKASLPTRDEHNQLVKQLYKLHQLTASTGSPEQASRDYTAELSRTGKVAWNIISWAKYHVEETELVQNGNVSSILASKTINARMLEAAGRSARTRDWASDGRRAARMFLDALREQPIDSRYFALMLLAKNVSADQLLKIAHFPALRAHFAQDFAATVAERAGTWRALTQEGYGVLNIDDVLGF